MFIKLTPALVTTTFSKSQGTIVAFKSFNCRRNRASCEQTLCSSFYVINQFCYLFFFSLKVTLVK